MGKSGQNRDISKIFEIHDGRSLPLQEDEIMEKGLTNKLRFAAFLAMVLLAGAALSQQRNGANFEVQLKAASQKELIDGDLKGAIAAYQKIADSARTSNPAVAAQALIEAGRLYEKLAAADAAKAYERVIREFGQTEAATLARARLAALGAPQKVAVTYKSLTQISKNYQASASAAVTPDGRYLYDLYGVLDTVTGELHQVRGSNDPDDLGGYGVAISADGKQIAYGRGNRLPRPSELRVRTFDGGKPTSGRLLLQSAEYKFIRPFAWSLDNEHVYALLARSDTTYAIASFSATTGELRLMKSLEWRWPARLSLSPDGRYIAYDVPVEKDSINRDILLLAVDGSGEVAVVESPSREANAVWLPDGSGLVFTSDRDNNPELSLVRISEGRRRGEPQRLRSNEILLPLGFARDGTFYYRKLEVRDDTILYAAEIDAATRTVSASEIPVGKRLGYLPVPPSLSPDGKRLAYLSQRHPHFHGSEFNGDLGPYTLVIRSLESQEETEIPLAATFVTTLAWLPDGQSILSGGRLDSDPWVSSIYRIELRTGKMFVDVLDSRRRGFALSPDATKIYYRKDESGWVNIVAYDIGTRRESTVYRESSPANPTRFAFTLSPDGERLVFRNGRPSLYAVSVEGGEPKELPGTIAEGQFAGWSSDGKMLFLDRGSQLWAVPLDGSEPFRLGTASYPRPSVSSGGKTVFFVRGQTSRQETAWADPDFILKKTQIYSLNLDPATSRVRGQAAAVTERAFEEQGSAKWSPDGKKIAFGRGNDVVVRTLATGAERVYPGNLSGWFHDGTSVLQYRRGPRIFTRLDLQSGISTEIATVDFAPDYYTLSPDDRTLHILTTFPAEIVQWDLTTNREKLRFRLPLRDREIVFGPIAVSPDGKTLAAGILAEGPGGGSSVSLVGADGGNYRGDFYKSRDSILDFLWTRDGRALLVADRFGASTSPIIRVPIAGGPPTTVTELRELISFDLSADGSRLVFAAGPRGR